MCVQAAPGRVITGSDGLVRFTPDGAGRSLPELNRLIGDVKEFGRQLPGDEFQVCLIMISELIRRLFPGGVHRNSWADDLLIGSAVGRRHLNVPADQWGEATSWRTLTHQVPAGGTVIVVLGRPGGHRHAVALIDTVEGVQIIDPRSADDVEVAPAPRPDEVETAMPALIGARALTIGPDGVIGQPREPLPGGRSGSVVDALTDPFDPRIAGIINLSRVAALWRKDWIPPFQRNGKLPPGEYRASWSTVARRFGGTPHRNALLAGLHAAATNLYYAGLMHLWLDGSFVTAKNHPNDYDGAWEPRGVNLAAVDPVLRDPEDLRTGREEQKAKYGGELLVDSNGTLRKFFQRDRTGGRKGVVRLDLRTLPPLPSRRVAAQPPPPVAHPQFVPMPVIHPQVVPMPVVVHPQVVHMPVAHPQVVWAPAVVVPAPRWQRRGWVPGAARGDDPVALRWPVGHPIVVEVTERGSWFDWRRRLSGEAMPSLVTRELHDDPLDAPDRPGKAAAPSWLFERSFSPAQAAGMPALGASQGSFGYVVDATGGIVLPDGVRISVTGWRRHGSDFVNVDETSRVVVLRADSGWVGLVANGDVLVQALRRRHTGTELPAYRTHIHNDALYLTPQEGVESVRVGPLRALRDADEIPVRSIEPERMPVPRVRHGIDWLQSAAAVETIGPHIDVGHDGLEWLSSANCVVDADGRRSCIEVTVMVPANWLPEVSHDSK